ncbi:zinc-dependent alcohol dehydrogenase family protein [Nocardiopsis sp. NPDC058631]|uniref:zinc-dependent alcohol dehydrogenase family protein n=1 Tax=Nocardiopsis sp. NPDC058631 TaxID=3346566 RepID=UPI00364679CA
MEPMMEAWAVTRPGPIATGPLNRVSRRVPEPGERELLIEVLTCAVCRTDLHLAEGDLAPRRPDTVPGHEVVGRVNTCGPGTGLYEPGARVGVAWLASTCGDCAYCRRGDENLCPYSTYTGWDRDGGFARYLTADERFVHPLPEALPDITAAPLLCAGVIGYRALERAELPEKGVLGLYGFGASAHLTAQVALARGARVHVMTRSGEARALALELGCHSASGAYDTPPEPLDAAILFAPVGELVPTALRALDRGGTLAVAGIHLSDIPALDYQRDLFQERSLRSVTANTRTDAREFLDFAAGNRLVVAVTPYPLESADRALADLAADRVKGAAVLRP